MQDYRTLTEKQNRHIEIITFMHLPIICLPKKNLSNENHAMQYYNVSKA